MVSFGLAVGIVVLLSLATFLGLNTTGLHPDFDNSVYSRGVPLAAAGLLLLLTPYVHQLLQGRRRRLSFGELPATVVPFTQYTLPGYVLIVEGILFVFAVRGIAMLSVWLVGLVSGFFFTTGITLINTLIVNLALFLVSAWIGARAKSRPSLIAIGCVLGFSALSALAGSLLGSNVRLLGLITSLVISGLVSLLGVWRGRRTRYVRYFQYLMAFVPAVERAAIAEQAYNSIRNRGGEPAAEPDEVVDAVKDYA